MKARCPAPGHGRGRGDHHPSLNVDLGTDGRVLLKCRAGAGCPAEDIVAALGLTMADLFAEGSTPRPSVGADGWLPCHRNSHGPTGHALVESYPYTFPDGRLSFTVTRCGSKCFAQWRPDPTSRSGRRWSITERSEDGTSRRVVPDLPYRLPAVLDAFAKGMSVWIVEGERDANRLAELGIASTCNSGGAGKWTSQHAEYLAGADVVVVADRDEPGWAHAEQVVETLLPLARSIEVVRAAEGKDARDHLDAGLGIHQFVQLAVSLPAPTAVPGCPDCTAEAVA